MKFRFILFMCFYFLSILSLAQEKFGLEFTAGTVWSQLSSETIPKDPFLSTNSSVGFKGGLGLTYAYQEDIGFVLQWDIVRRNYWLSYANFNMLTSFSFTQFGEYEQNLTLGLRKNWSVGKGKFYVQPGLTFVLVPNVHNPPNQEVLPNGDVIGLISARNLGLALRTDIGYSIPNLRGNHFNFGLRFQQGLTVNQHMRFLFPLSENDELIWGLKTRGTHFAIFTGYGLNGLNFASKRKSYPTRKYSLNKDIRQKLANEDGFYFQAYGGFRVKQPFTPRQDIYFNTSGQFSAVLGYKFGHFSLESGYGQFSAGNSISLEYEQLAYPWTEWIEYGINTSYVPLTFKYDIPISEKKTVRFGPTFSGLYLLTDHAQNQREFTSRSNGGVFIDENTTIEVSGLVNSLPIEKYTPIMFNAGLHLEFQAFNSSFMSLNISRNFGSPVISRFEADYQIGSGRYQFIQESTLNGFRFDFGWKLPLNILDRQKKNALRSQY